MKLQRFVTALPVGTRVNTCTASGEVLDSVLSLGAGSLVRQFSVNPDDLAARRKDTCFPLVDDLTSTIGQARYDQFKEHVELGESSSYFRATVWVTIGTTQFTLYSLLARGGAGSVRPVLRSFGAE